MIALTLRWICAAVMGGGMLLASVAEARSLVCESQDHMTQYCNTDTSNGVTLAVQYSKASCRQGVTWGYDRRGIWVSNGCRAQFDIGEYRTSNRHDNNDKAAAALAIGLIGAAIIASKDDNDRPHRYDTSRPLPQPAYVTCESQDNRVQYCDMPLRHANVDISRQLSRAACVYRQSWGYDRRGIWVSEGCRAEFAVY